MATYTNGNVPYSVVSVVLATGTDSNGYWEFRCTPAFAARWAAAKAYALAHFGRTIYIRSGWNIYRPLFSQQIARTNACAEGKCNEAAYPGSSSHGGNWNGRDCLAVDVDPNGLSWAQVDEAMVSAGFSAGLITQAISGRVGGEPWHYIDFNAFGPVPAGLNSKDFDDMGTLDDTEANYQVFVKWIQRAYRFDARPNGVGATYTLGPTVFELLRAADDSADVKAVTVAITEEDRAQIAALVAASIKIPAGGASKADVEAAVKSGLNGLSLTAQSR